LTVAVRPMSSPFDDEGYLLNPRFWNEEIAGQIATKQFGMALTEVHWTCIHIVRKYYDKWSSLPMVKTIREEAGITAEEFEGLFKRGTSSSRGVLCKISGLPKILCIAAGC